MTGLLSSEHWCTTRNTRLSGKVKTLPDYLVPQGYEAVAFHSNPWLTEGLSGILRSFQTHYVDSQGDSRTHAAGGSQGGAENNRNIAEWLDTRDGDKPFLLFVNYLEAHLPYDPSAEVRAAQLPDLPRDDYVSVQWAFEFNAGLHPSGDVDWTRVRRLYQGDASTADALLGDLMQMLKERGLYENSVIIVTSDHGENLGDHGLMDHQFGLFESLLAVPLVVRAPGMLDQGVRNDPVMLSDVFPSILEAAGMTDVPSLPHARSLFGPPAPPDRPLIAQYAGGSPGLVELLWRMNPKLETAHLLTPYSSIRIGDLRLTVGNDGSNLLQDFSRNRASSRDLRNDSREIAERMKSELPTFVAPVGDTQIGEHMRETLRSLGYLP
jgi:arylsulfatase A-like enzyme